RVGVFRPWPKTLFETTFLEARFTGIADTLQKVAGTDRFRPCRNIIRQDAGRPGGRASAGPLERLAVVPGHPWRLDRAPARPYGAGVGSGSQTGSPRTARR